MEEEIAEKGKKKQQGWRQKEDKTGVSNARRKVSKKSLQACRGITRDRIIYRWLLLVIDGGWQHEDAGKITEQRPLASKFTSV